MLTILHDGRRGTLPSWMTNAAACAALTVGTPVVAITALQELRVLLDVLARGSDLTEVAMPSEEGGDAPKASPELHPDPAVPTGRGSAQKAIAFGWPNPVTILDDLGLSAAGFAERAGFQHMVAEVSLGTSGSSCVSKPRGFRATRRTLFELCGHLDTLVADLDQV
jgi:hypothetical protein